jgi:hypothetical protein
LRCNAVIFHGHGSNRGTAERIPPPKTSIGTCTARERRSHIDTILTTLQKLHEWQPGNDTEWIEPAMVAIGRGDLITDLATIDPSCIEIAIAAIRRKLIQQAIDDGDLIEGWEPPFPTIAVNSLASLTSVVSEKLSEIRRELSFGDVPCLLDVCRVLRNTRRALVAIGVPFPKGFTWTPVDVFDGERQLELIVAMKGRTTTRHRPQGDRDGWLLDMADSGITKTHELRIKLSDRNPGKKIPSKDAIRQALCRKKRDRLRCHTNVTDVTTKL